MNFFLWPRGAFGLDISELSLKIAKLEKSKDGSLKLASFNQAQIPANVVKGGEIKNIQKLSDIMRKSVLTARGGKIKTKYVICSLPEEKVFLDTIQMPKMSREDLKTAVQFEAENYIPLPLKNVYLDFQVVRSIDDRAKKMDVLLGAVSKKIADSYIKMIKTAGFQPLALEVESLAIARAVIPNDKIKQPFLIIDFGATRTSFIIFGGFSVRFTTTIPISSQAITKSIARNLEISTEEAEKLKINYGMEKRKIFEATIPALTDLIEQIKTHLNYYKSHILKKHNLHKEEKITKILLCGNGALLKGLPEFLSSELKMKVEFANPWVNILKPPLKEIPGLSFEKSLGYATALGLSLRGVRKNNLLAQIVND